MKFCLIQKEIFFPALSSHNMLLISSLIHKQNGYCALSICVFAKFLF